jgi:hypothetical protein
MKKIDDIESWMTGYEGELQLKPGTSPQSQPDASPLKNKATGETLPVASRPPRTGLLEHQLKRVIGKDLAGEMREKLTRAAIDLYRSLEPQDTIDAIVANIIVGLNSMTMNCLERASTINLRAEEVRLKYAIKGATVLSDLLKQYQGRRTRIKSTA